eukprot:07904_4
MAFWIISDLKNAPTFLLWTPPWIWMLSATVVKSRRGCKGLSQMVFHPKQYPLCMLCECIPLRLFPSRSLDYIHLLSLRRLLHTHHFSRHCLMLKSRSRLIQCLHNPSKARFRLCSIS